MQLKISSETIENNNIKNIHIKEKSQQIPIYNKTKDFPIYPLT